MPRNSAGTYTLPAGNPVVAGTTIDASWANDTMSDLANEITNSLSRTGAGGMLAPFRVADGSVSAPGLGFTNETNSGLYRAGTGELWFTIGGVAVAQITGSGLLIPSGKRISLPAPVNDADGANKEYVDDLVNPVIQYANYYLGPKSSDPSVNNTGGALTEGSTYWSTTLDQMRVYNGTTWEPMPSTASLQGQTFNGTGAQTAFTLAAPTGNATNLEVFISGVRQVPTTDYTVSGTTLTFTSAPPSGTDNIYVRFAQLIALASADSSNVSYLPAGTGAVATTVQSKLRETVSVLDFGADPTGVADSTTAIQAAVNTGKLVKVPTGVYAVSSPITLPRGGATIVGDGELGFGQAVIRPLATFSGSALFIADGDNETGGWAFRNRLQNLLLWCDRVNSTALPVVIAIDKAYTIFLENLWIQDVPGSAIQLSANNYIVISKCMMAGRSNASSPYGVNVISDSADDSGGGVFISDCDIENFQVGVRQATNSKVVLVNPYIERNGIGWQAAGSSAGNMTVVGGRIVGINASTNCASIAGPNVTVLGGAYSPNGGGGIRTDSSATRYANIQVYNVPATVYQRYRNMYELNTVSNEDAGWVETQNISTKTVDDAVATNLFAITCPSNSNNTGFFEVEVFCRMSGNNEVVSKARYSFSFSNTGTIRANTVIESDKSGWGATGNWSLTISGAASASGSTINFQITADTGGALGAGRQTFVSAKARMVTPVTSGGIYFEAA